MFSLHTTTGTVSMHPNRRDKTVTVTVKDADGAEASVTLVKRDAGTIAAAMKYAVGFPVRKVVL